jgi:hypothetical protein
MHSNKQNRGSQPANRDIDKVRRQWRIRSARYAEKNEGPIATIGIVPQLVLGATNPMWAATYSVSKLAKRLAGKLKLPKPQRFKKINMNMKDGFYVKHVPVPDEEDEPILEPLEDDVKKEV